MDLTQVIVNFEGEPMVFKTEVPNEDKEAEKEYTEENLTAQKVIHESIFFADGKIEGDEVEGRYDLHLKIKDAEQVNFTDKEKELIKKIVSPRWNVLIAGQLIKML